MSAIVTNKFRLNNAQVFYDSFNDYTNETSCLAAGGTWDSGTQNCSIATNKYYLFVGRTQAWADDNAPPVPGDTTVSEYAIYRDIIAAKHVGPSDVTFVVPRRNWVTGTIYDMYHHAVSATNLSSTGATNLWDSKFYVMNANYNVYICIYNNGGTASTATPTGTSATIFTAGDGYMWKYLYTIGTSDVQKYLSLDFMPCVEDATIASTAVGGSIEYTSLVSGGGGYLNSAIDGNTGLPIPDTIAIHGDGVNGTVDVVIETVNSVPGVFTSVQVNNVGLDYTFASLDLVPLQDPNQTIHYVEAKFDLVVSPTFGHGANNKKELGAFFVMMNATIAGAEGSGDFIVDQDFRQVGVVKNPTDNGVRPTTTTLSGLKSVDLTGLNNIDFVIDEVVTTTSAGTKGIAVISDFIRDVNDTTKGTIKYIQQSEIGSGLAADGDIDLFVVGDVIESAASIAQGTVSVVTPAEIDTYSGDILYIENRMPISRATDQQENIKLIVEF